MLNLILPAYLLSAFWLYAARRRADAATRSGFWLAAFLAALIVGRRPARPPGLPGRRSSPAPTCRPPNSTAIRWPASLVAIGLIFAGIRLPDKALRLAGLLLLTATIVKVFLVDASELEGVLRILSFLLLGIALIGDRRASMARCCGRSAPKRLSVRWR